MYRTFSYANEVVNVCAVPFLQCNNEVMQIRAGVLASIFSQVRCQTLPDALGIMLRVKAGILRPWTI
jgi:hypothetical protein